MPIVSVPKVIREKLGDEGADALISLINEATMTQRNETLGVAADKFERRLAEEMGKVSTEFGKVRQEMADLRTDLTTAMGALETRLTTKMAGLETGLTTRMANLETRVIRWMFLFWVGQIGVLLGFLFTFFRA